MHVVPDTLRNGLPLQLREHRRDIHHRSAHGGGRVELLPDGNEVNVPVAQVLNELRKVTNVAADPVEAVDHDGRKFALLRVLHHFFELRALQITTGKTLVLIYQHLLCCILSKMHGNILAAQLNLVLDAFALPSEFGFAGVNNVLLRLRLVLYSHSGTSHCFVYLADI